MLKSLNLCRSNLALTLIFGRTSLVALEYWKSTVLTYSTISLRLPDLSVLCDVGSEGTHGGLVQGGEGGQLEAVEGILPDADVLQHVVSTSALTGKEQSNILEKCDTQMMVE